MGTKNCLGVTLCACLTVTSITTHAVESTWLNHLGDSFEDGINWSTGTAPAGGDVTIFDLNASYAVDFFSNPFNQKALIRNGDVTFALDGATYTLTSTAFPQASLTVGELNGNVGQLTITDGTVASYRNLVGDQAGSKGTLNITSGGILSATQVLYVGYYGDGDLNITDGGTVSNVNSSILGFRDGASGNAVVDGVGSSWTTSTQYIGYENNSVGSLTVKNDALVTVNGPQYLGFQNGSTGDMTIQSGGDVQVNNHVFIANAANSSSAVIVDGAGSSLSATGVMRVGSSGTGSLTVTDGATISSTNTGIVGVAATAMGTVDIDASTWTNAGELAIGWQGNGTMNISNGGMVSNTNSSIGRFSGSTGEVNVDGTNTTSTWANSGDVSVGGLYQDILGGGPNNSTGDGTLNITNGGVVTAGRFGFIGTTRNSTGAMTVDGAGSSFDSVSGLYVGYYGTGIMDVTDGGTVSSLQGFVGTVNTPTNSSAVTISGTNSNWTTSSYLDIRYGSLDINNGGSVTTQDYGILRNSIAEVSIDGDNSSWDITNYLDNFGTLNISNGGEVIAGSYILLRTGSNTTVNGDSAALQATTLLDNVGGTLNILNGSDAAASNTYVRNGGVTNIAGADAALSSGFVYVGGTNVGAQATGILNVNVGGIANVNTLKLWSTGTVNLNGGTINIDTLDIDSGAFNFDAGKLNFTSDFALGAAGPLGSSYSLNSLQHLGVDGMATIDPTSVLTLDGGTFSAGSLVNNGTFQFNSGTFNLTNSNMNIGAGGLLGSNVQLASNQTVNITNATTVNSGGVLTLNHGSFSSGALTNDGDIVLNGSSSRLGGTLQNNSLLKGNGRVDAQVTNANGAQIRVAGGESMRFTAAGNTNAGRIEVISGEVEFDQNLVNQSSTGNIVARDAILRFSGGLNNQGNVGLSFGTTDVFGDINNTGSVTISGNGNATFYDDYTNNGVTQTSSGSNAVFFGTVSGAGSFAGTGTLFFEGDLAPGNSPALVDVGGDIVFGFGLTTVMELAGTLRGSEYDAFDIAGDLSLGGVLDIDFLSGFSITEGDYFDLFMAENIYGNFASLLFPGLAGGMEWDLTLYEDLNGSMDVLRLSAVSSVPVPAAVWLFGSGLIGLISLARRKAHA